MITKKTQTEIYDIIANEIANQSQLQELQPNIDTSQALLQDLTSTSKVAAWRIFTMDIAYAISLLYEDLENWDVDLEEYVNNNVSANDVWLRNAAYDFQLGDIISVDELNYRTTYPVIDTTKQIIKFVATERSLAGTVLKVIKDAGKLTTDELTQFTAYIDSIKPAGSTIIIRSVDADQVKLYMEVEYDGQRVLDNIKTDVESIVNDYVKNIEFNSQFKASTLISRILEINGVVDARFNYGLATNAISATEITFTRFLNSYAGWFQLNNSVTLDDTITYIQKTNY